VYKLVVDGIVINFWEMKHCLAFYGLWTSPYVDDFKYSGQSIEELQQKTRGNSLINTSTQRKGVILRNDKKNLWFSVKNPDFSLFFH